MKREISILFFFLIIFKLIHAQEDSLVQRLMREAKVTGICIGLVENNKSTLCKSLWLPDQRKKSAQRHIDLLFRSFPVQGCIRLARDEAR